MQAERHGATVAALTWYNNYTPKDAILTPSVVYVISEPAEFL
jgi:hypothetical protein